MSRPLPALLFAIFFWLCDNWHRFDNIVDSVPFLRGRRRRMLLTGHITTARSFTSSHISLDMCGLLFHFHNNLDRFTGANKVLSLDIDSMTVHIPVQSTPFDIGNGLAVDVAVYDESHDDKNGKVTRKDVNITLYSSERNFADVQAFIKACSSKYKEQLHKRFEKQHVFDYACQDDSDKPTFEAVLFTSGKTFDNTFFEAKDMIRGRLIEFESSSARDRSWKLGVPHTLGFLFHGPPGTAKTSVIKAIANHTKRHIMRVPMARLFSQSPDNCVDVLRRMMLKPAVNGIVLAQRDIMWVFEEVDCWQSIVRPRSTKGNKCVGDARNAAAPETTADLLDMLKEATIGNADDHAPPSQLGVLLELLDGVIEMPNRLIIMTTNHRERIDAAVTRPGRMDVDHEFTYLTRKDVRQYFQLWFDKPLPEDAERAVHDFDLCQADIAKIFRAADANSAANRVFAFCDKKRSKN
jgi:hypothetical protein